MKTTGLICGVRLARSLLKLLLLGAVFSAIPSQAQVVEKPLKLIELFTSHGCSSCPKADQLLGDLLRQHDDLLALEFHVDYWNDLVHGSDGSFIDPFSHADHTLRQRAYNKRTLSGRPGVYTPQAVVNGRVAMVGSNRHQIEKTLQKAPVQSMQIQFQAEDALKRLKVTLTVDAQQQNLAGADIIVVRYLDKARTLVTGGENRHKELENHHIVIDSQLLGTVEPTAEMVFDIATPRPGEGCVVLVQADVLTPVFAAAACP